MNENNVKYLYITSNMSRKKEILEKLPAFSYNLYYTMIKLIESYAIIKDKLYHPKSFILWHNRISHLGSTMIRIIIENSHGHPFKDLKILLSSENSCTACSQRKLVVRPSPSKINFESPSFLQRIQEDICGLIHPQSGPFRYFIILIDASTRWSHVCLLSTRNIAFARLLAQIIRLRAQFLDYLIKTIRLDNAGEFTFKIFNNYCMTIGIDIEHLIPYVHTQNELSESLIKCLQVIARTLLLQS